MGQIALLHIDGNRDRAAAEEDVLLWSPHVARGGWVVIDDYNWRYGDGPKQAGDALLERWGEGAARAFAAGDCLFIQRAGACDRLTQPRRNLALNSFLYRDRHDRQQRYG
ncbi:class I SAM-dependent methyltransferase [Sphingomonas sp.]|uniref:class I SAM-dependent methyltransferase n=1 Tax=Sphingomonas sp. TaxID=28214 RepID=UPI0028A9296C|nr:class I SAM-dependent methyltransferase [Sphingomonas sp.]